MTGRTYCRSYRTKTFSGSAPTPATTPFTEQPFFYGDQGYPDILELGVQGYQDDFYWDRFDDRRHGDTYDDYLFAMFGRGRHQ